MQGIERVVKWCFLVALSGIFFTAPAMAQDFPKEPITLITWSSIGGGGDILGRYLQEPLGKAAGVPIIILNKPGGSGAVAMEYVHKLKPDGYQLLIATTSGITSPLATGGRISVADFKSVIRIQNDPEVMMVRADSPFKTAKDVIAAAKAKPGSIKFAGSSVGQVDSMLVYELCQMNGIQFTYVPFGGGGEAMTALLGGHVDVLFGNPSEVFASVEAGQIRLIAIATKERNKDMPDVPTLKEQGMDLEYVLWRGISAPPGTPDDRVKKLNNLIKKACESPAFQDYTKKSKLMEGYLTAADFDASIKREYNKFKELIGKMGIKK